MVRCAGDRVKESRYVYLGVCVCLCRRLQKMPSELSTAKGSFWQRQKQSDSNGTEERIRNRISCIMLTHSLTLSTYLIHTIARQLLVHRCILTFMRLLLHYAMLHEVCSLIPFICCVCLTVSLSIYLSVSFSFCRLLVFDEAKKWRWWFSLFLCRCVKCVLPLFWRNTNTFVRHAMKKSDMW